MATDWTDVIVTKVIPLVGAGLCGWFAPRALNAWKNRGKTKEQIAAERLADALKAQEAALRDADPNNDHAFDDDVRARRAAYEKAREDAAWWEGFARGGPHE